MWNGRSLYSYLRVGKDDLEESVRRRNAPGSAVGLCWYRAKGPISVGSEELPMQTTTISSLDVRRGGNAHVDAFCAIRNSVDGYSTTQAPSRAVVSASFVQMSNNSRQVRSFRTIRNRLGTHRPNLFQSIPLPLFPPGPIHLFNNPR